MKAKIKLVLAGLAIACLIWAFVAAQHKVGRSVPQHPSLLVAAVLLYLCQPLYQALGWHLVLRGLNQKITVAQSFHMWFMSLMTRWIPGPLQWVSRLFLAKEYGVSPGVVGFALVIELSYIVLSALVVSVVFSASAVATLLSQGHGVSISIFLGVILIGLLAFVAQPSLMISFLRCKPVHRIASRMAKTEIDWDQVPMITRVQSLQLLGFYLVYWVLSGVGFVVLARAFIPVPFSAWPPYLASFPASWLIGFLSVITPGGLGVREAALYFMLAPVTSQGMAVVLAVWSRIVMLVSESLSVGLIFLLTRKSLKNLKALELQAELAQASE